jgi:SAM-dependent methyltransferase
MVDECLLRSSYLHPNIVELGCGTGDISGPYAEKYKVIGLDVCAPAIEEAKVRYPQLLAHCADICTIPTLLGSILILCETLEHLANPEEICKTWLPNFEYSVISHPLEGDVTPGVELSGGEHQWSFNRQDFENWFAIGGHELEDSCVFPMGGYNIILGRGRRK